MQIPRGKSTRDSAQLLIRGVCSSQWRPWQMSTLCDSTGATNSFWRCQVQRNLTAHPVLSNNHQPKLLPEKYFFFFFSLPPWDLKNTGLGEGFLFCFSLVFWSGFFFFHFCVLLLSEVLSHKKVFQPSSVPLWSSPLWNHVHIKHLPIWVLFLAHFGIQASGEPPRTTRKLCCIYMIWPHLSAEVLLLLCPVPPTGGLGSRMGDRSPLSLEQGEKEEQTNWIS